MANLYYREDLDADAFRVGSDLEIVGEEARHALRVSRLRVGERTTIGNTRGALGAGEVVSAERDRFIVRLDEVRIVPAPERTVALVQALAKGDRDERAVEQATEFGVDRIVPWQAERSVSRWDGAGGAEKSAKGVAKWRRVAREASKQSLRPRVPEVTEPITLDGLCRAAKGGATVLVLHPAGARALSEHLAASGPGPDVLLVIGPEGGLSEHELTRLSAAGAQILRLGETVLRTSSAGPAALAVLNVVLRRW